MKDAAMPTQCPSCGAGMVVVKLECPQCSTEINGEFDLCPVCRLEGQWRELFNLFLKARGNLKEVQRMLQVSYPTARQRVEDMFQKLGQKPETLDSKTVLARLRAGEISVDQAEELLRSCKNS